MLSQFLWTCVIEGTGLCLRPKCRSIFYNLGFKHCEDNASFAWMSLHAIGGECCYWLLDTLRSQKAQSVERYLSNWTKVQERTSCHFTWMNSLSSWDTVVILWGYACRAVEKLSGRNDMGCQYKNIPVYRYRIQGRQRISCAKSSDSNHRSDFHRIPLDQAPASGASNSLLWLKNSELTWIGWSPAKPVLAMGSSRGHVLVYNNLEKRKIPVVGKHTKRILCGCWGSDNAFALGGADHQVCFYLWGRQGFRNPRHNRKSKGQKWIKSFCATGFSQQWCIRGNVSYWPSDWRTYWIVHITEENGFWEGEAGVGCRHPAYFQQFYPILLAWLENIWFHQDPTLSICLDNKSLCLMEVKKFLWIAQSPMRVGRFSLDGSPHECNNLNS